MMTMQAAPFRDRADAARRLADLPGLSWATVAPLFGAGGRFTGEVNPGPFTDIPDPADRRFAALAKAAEAVLVSSDRRLVAGAVQMSVPVVSPAECVRRHLGGNEGGLGGP